MLESVFEELSSDVFCFICSNKKLTNDGLVVRKHSEHLQKLGDFSFSSSPRFWRTYILDDNTCSDLDTVLQSLVDDLDIIVRESKRWKLQVRTTMIIKDRVHLFLERPLAIRSGLLEALKNNALIHQKITQNSASLLLDPLCADLTCVTSLRLKYLAQAIRKLYCLSESCQKLKPTIFVTHKSTSDGAGCWKILCGAVLNSNTNVKESVINADDFIRLRQNEMTLIAQHKYGVRVTTDYKWKQFLSHLGESAATFELLETKPASAVKINFDCSSGSSKGAAFVLYNCARLESIIKSYNEKVSEGTYPPLPKIEDVDFRLLNQEDEWTLVYNYILGLPLLLRQSVEVSKHVSEFRPHLVCSYLSGMVRVFSQYYRRTRILTEPRIHLQPVMFARLHMITILNETLKTCLKILNIKSVTQMYNAPFISSKSHALLVPLLYYLG